MRTNLSPGELFRGQAEFFSSGVRVQGSINSDLVLRVFHNNSLQTWNLADGSSVADSSISSGFVYFHQIPSANGFYSVRLFPDKIGYWRIHFFHNPSSSSYSLDFDVRSFCSPSSGPYYSFL